jgi:sugar lactone lactonase YvrE
MEVDLERDRVKRTFSFGPEVAPEGSYLNDVRVDVKRQTAYLTDSGLGALVVLDLATGEARRVLAGHPSTQAQDTVLQVGTRAFDRKVHSDGIALDVIGDMLYFQPLLGRTMYRVPTSALRDASLDADALAAKVEPFVESGAADGLLFGHDGGVYVSALEKSAILRVDAAGQIETLIADPRIAWPDSFAQTPDGTIYFTTSLIHLGPDRDTPYGLWKLGGTPPPRRIAPAPGITPTPTP